MFSMTNYYYIVASLPAISQDWKFGDRTARGLMDEIKGQSTAKDLALIEFVERGFDDGNLDADFYRQALSHRNRFIREYYAFDPVIAMLSYSNFGSNLHEGTAPASCQSGNCGTPSAVHQAVELLHERYPDMVVDGEMRMDMALNRKLRDRTYPFNRLYGKEVNTLIFPDLNSSSAAWRMMMEMGTGEAIGPIQIGLNKPVHFISVEAPVQEIVNLATLASLDAAIYLKAGNCLLDR